MRKMSGNCQQGSALPSSADCQLSQDSDEDDVSNGELWNHRSLQHQVGYLTLERSFSGSLSPQPSSSVECERRVSPLDPNLSSAARYSPPPPYSSAIDEIEASIEQPTSPLGDLSNANSLSSLPAGVSSSISSASESLVITEAHGLSSPIGFPSVSRPHDVKADNSLFSSTPSSIRTQPKWAPPRLSFSEDFQSTLRPPAESIWAKQKRLASTRNLQLNDSESDGSRLNNISLHESSNLQISHAAGPSGLQETPMPGPSGFRIVGQSGSRLLLPSSRSPKNISHGASREMNISEGAGPSGLQSLSYFEGGNMQALSEAGCSRSQTLPQAASGNLDGVSLPEHSLSKIKSIPQSLISKPNDSSSSDDDSSEMLPNLNPTPGPSGVRNHLVHLNDSDAEALADIVSGCEASSSNVRGHLSPLQSPSTPADNCIVSSSTGHIDSIPPTPVEFQGNDVSEPNSPISPNLTCVAILDSTVDSTSGRGILEPEEQSSEESSDEDLSASAQLPLPVITDEGAEITTSEAVLQNSDDSQDVSLLVSPQGMFASERGSASRFIEQLSLSLSQFPSNSLDAGLSADEGEKCEPNAPPSSSSIAYLDDSLAIPGPSRLSLGSSCQIPNTHQPRTDLRDNELDQPSTSGRQNLAAPVAAFGNNLPLLDITEGLSSCSVVVDTNQLTDEGEPENCEPLVSLSSNVNSNVVSGSLAGQSGTQNIGQLNPNHPHHQSYGLELNDENSMSSDVLSPASLGKDDLAERSINVKSYSHTDEATTHDLLDPEQLVASSLNASLNLNLSASPVEVSVSLPVSSQQHTLAHPLLQSQPDQVSLLVGGGDESSDGALLMMVSSNEHSLTNGLSVGKHELRGDANSHIPRLSDTDSQILQSESIDQELQNLSFEKSNNGKKELTNEVNENTKNVDGFVEANFWCGECEQMYNIECPQHGMQRIADRTMKTRTWKSLPDDGLGIDKSADVEGCLTCGQKSSQECPHYRIQTICDKPVKTRAWASLPAQHLIIRRIPLTNDYGVFARKSIPKRTRFGPLEGMLVESPDKALVHITDFTIFNENAFLMVDTSDEDCSNWMRFVRKATTYLEQNCVVVQIEDALYFLTSTDIQPRTELRVGYSKQYADRRCVSTLEPTDEEIQILDSMRKCWPCYECDEGFETSAELQQHLVSHDEVGNEEDKKKRKRVKTRRTRPNGDPEPRSTKRVKTEENEPVRAETSKAEGEERVQSGCMEGFQRSQCLTCNFIFPMPELLKIHQLKHIDEALSEDSIIKNEEREQDFINNDSEGLGVSKTDSKVVYPCDESSDLHAEKEEGLKALQSCNKTCPQCKKVCSDDDELLVHVEEHGAFHAGSSKPFKCDYCYKSFTRRFRLEAHKSVHGSEAEKPFRCNMCMRKFCSNSALTAHIRFHIEGCKGYDCPICREGFFSVAGLKSHVSTHCINGEYKCPKCNKVFPTYSKIRRHIRSYHAIMPHTCSLCGKEMPSVDKLKIHMLSHSDRRDFLCLDCGKRFKRKDKLKEHAKRMHSAEREDRSPKTVNKGPPKFVPKVDPADYKQFVYKCTTCMLGFKRRGMLVNHLAKRHPNVDMKCVPELNQPILKATRCYKCQHCDKRYRSSSKRKLHILKYHPGAELPPRTKAVNDQDNEGSSYTSSYPHPCNWCYRQYASRARLLRHQRHHHPSHFNNEGGTESENNNDVAFLDAPGGLAGELSLNGHVVDVNILRSHRLANIVRASPDSVENDGGNEEDLLTQAMGEITPLTARPLLVSGSGGQQGTTLALVAAEGPDGVTLSLPNGQLISLIPGLSVAGTSSAVASSSRTTNNGEDSSLVEGTLLREDGKALRMAYALGPALGESNNEAEAVEQVVLAAQQPQSPSNQVVWQHALAFGSSAT